jgi:hypothetical protein
LPDDRWRGDACILEREVTLKRYTIGFLAGLLVGTAASALAVGFVGSNGYLINWTVTEDGLEICRHPYIYVSYREIECD